MKKILIGILTAAVLLTLSSCGGEKENYFSAELTASQVFSDNAGALNSDVTVCVYGEYYIAKKHNYEDNSNSIVTVDRKTKESSVIYKRTGEILSLKPVSNTEICLLDADDRLSYINLNLETGKTTKITPEISSQGEILSITPYFTESTVYIDALTGAANEGEPYHSLYTFNGGTYAPFIENCSQFQISEGGVLYSYGGSIMFKDSDGKEQELLSFDFDNVFNVFAGKYLVSCAKGYYEIIDPFTNETICSEADISKSGNGGFEGGVAVYGENMYFSTYGGIEQLNLTSGKTEKLVSVYPDYFFVFEDKLFFETGDSVFVYNINNSAIETLF